MLGYLDPRGFAGGSIPLDPALAAAAIKSRIADPLGMSVEQAALGIHRIINAGGIPRKNPVLNRVYANVLKKPILVPDHESTSLGSAIFAFLAAGAFPTIEAAQEALCPSFAIVEPDAAASAVYDELFPLYRDLYFALGRQAAAPAAIGHVLPALRRIAAAARSRT